MFNFSFKPSESIVEIKNTRLIYSAALVIFLIVFILLFIAEIKSAPNILLYTSAIFALVTFWATRKIGIKLLWCIFWGLVVFLFPGVSVQGILLPIVPLISAYAVLGWKIPK